MPVKTFVPEVIVEEPKSPALDFSVVRKWSDVAAEIQKLRGEGVNVPDIAEQLKVSYVLVHQCVLQSYKILIDSVQVFERHEGKRLNPEG
jgi:TolB-like protein